MAARVISLYTLAVVAALALLYLSLFWLPWRYYYPFLKFATWIAISGIMVTVFLWDYMRYAIAEWGDFAPRGASAMVLYTLAYTVMYTSLMAAALFGGSAGTVINLAVWAAFLSSAVLVALAIRGGELNVTSGDIKLDLMAGTKTLPLALAVGLPYGWLMVAAYEGYRMVAAGARLAGLSVAVSILSLFFLPPRLLDLHGALAVSPLYPLLAEYTGVEILAWPGIIAWEELTSRFALPAVGPVANYMFVALHAPSRWVFALLLAPLLAPAILAVISMATRWVTDVYRRHGLVGAIAAHAVYNGMIGWLYGAFYFPLLTALTLGILAHAYIRVYGPKA